MSQPTPPAGAGRPPRAPAGGMAEKLAKPKVITGAVITVLALWFIFANSEKVRIHFWLVWVSAQLWIVLLLVFLAGAFVGFLFAKRRGHGVGKAKPKA